MTLRLPIWPPDWPSIRTAAADCVESGDWGRYGSLAGQTLASRLADQFGVHSVRLCSSGSAAVELSLRAAGVGTGDEVITAAFDYPGNVRAIELIGARPVLVDVSPDSCIIDSIQVKAAGSDRVKAVIASHLYGVAADVILLRQICDDRGWTLIEDACQVAGMRIGDGPAGSIGHFGTLSMGGSKLVTCGSGGAVFAGDSRAAARLATLIDRPSDAFSLAPLAAAVVMPQLDRLDELNQRRRETANFIRHEVLPSLIGWTWESGDDADAAFYKVAFTVASSSERSRIIAAATEIGLPIGEGFRSLANTSERRCRKPVPLDRSRRLGETLLVLDHRALLIDPDQRVGLADAMKSLV